MSQKLKLCLQVDSPELELEELLSSFLIFIEYFVHKVFHLVKCLTFNIQ